MDSEIVIIGIDDDSLGVLGRWPWPGIITESLSGL